MKVTAKLIAKHSKTNREYQVGDEVIKARDPDDLWDQMEARHGEELQFLTVEGWELYVEFERRPSGRINIDIYRLV